MAWCMPSVEIPQFHPVHFTTCSFVCCVHFYFPAWP